MYVGKPSRSASRAFVRVYFEDARITPYPCGQPWACWLIRWLYSGSLGAVLLCSGPWALWWYAGYVLDALCFLNDNVSYIVNKERDIILVVFAEQI